VKAPDFGKWPQSKVFAAALPVAILGYMEVR
jgi:hypothetical protein